MSVYIFLQNYLKPLLSVLEEKIIEMKVSVLERLNLLPLRGLASILTELNQPLLGVKLFPKQINCGFVAQIEIYGVERIYFLI